MKSVLMGLLQLRAINFRALEIDNISSDFKSLGIADSIPDFGTFSDEIFIWHAPSGMLPITSSELIRFGLDAPKGFNLILSEREVQPDCQSVDTFNFLIIEPNIISKWLGEAVLSGELKASAKEEESENFGEINIQNNTQIGIYVLKPLIENRKWANSRGMDGFSSSPVLLAARMWTIMGDLQGPNGEIESRKWEILEDPWSQNLSQLNGTSDMLRSPMLRTIEPIESNWFSTDRLYVEISKLLEERRRGISGETSASGTVRSMRLQNWTLNIDDASFIPSKVMIPAWQIDSDPIKVLHGRDGRLYDF